VEHFLGAAAHLFTLECCVAACSSSVLRCEQQQALRRGVGLRR